jgi:sugar phosphate isomerase/epimerase
MRHLLRRLFMFKDSAQSPQLPVSVRDAMVRDAMAGTSGSTIDGLRDLGVSAVELDLQPDGSLPILLAGESAPFSIATDLELGTVRDLLTASQVRVSALLLATDFASPDPSAHIDWTLRAIAAAEALGALAVRIDVTHWAPGLSMAQIRERFVERVSRILDQTPNSPVDLAIENHGKISNDPQFLDEVFAAQPNKRLGLTLDTGNFYWYGFPLGELYDLIERFAPRARHTHIKSINYPPELANQRRPMGFEYGKYCSPLDEGNLDLPRIVGLLKAGGYRRGLCIENESLGKYPADQRMNILRRDVAAVREAIAKNSVS